MPFVRISLPQSISESAAAHVGESVHRALMAAFSVPEDDRFQVISRHAPQDLICTPQYMGISHSAAVALIQITVSEGRSVEKKKALYAMIATEIARGGVIAAADVIINLIEVKKENWSFGNGIAQYADQP